MKALDLCNRRFGKLLAVEPVGRTSSGRRKWRCLCDCGNEKNVTASNLVSGNSTSCGCVAREKARQRQLKHGLRHHPLYRVWRAMIVRCYNENSKSYPNYGGRGIAVCDRWRTDFTVFLSDMGERPFPGASIERLDNDGGYSAENCAWATAAAQASNRRTRRDLRPTRLRAPNGDLLVIKAGCIGSFADEFGILSRNDIGTLRSGRRKSVKGWQHG